MAAISANSLKIGNVIEYDGGLWKVSSLSHVKPGKGGAFIQAVMKNIKTGVKLDKRFRSSESVYKARHESVGALFLFSTNSAAEFSLSDTFEQVSIDKGLLGDKFSFLDDNMEVSIQMVEDEIVDIQLPESVVCEVISTQPKMKNQTVTSTLKPAILGNGLTVMVPQFVEEGDRVSVKTDDCSYIERA